MSGTEQNRSVGERWESSTIVFVRIVWIISVCAVVSDVDILVTHLMRDYDALDLKALPRTRRRHFVA